MSAPAPLFLDPAYTRAAGVLSAAALGTPSRTRRETPAWIGTCAALAKSSLLSACNMQRVNQARQLAARGASTARGLPSHGAASREALPRDARTWLPWALHCSAVRSPSKSDMMLRVCPRSSELQPRKTKEFVTVLEFAVDVGPRHVSRRPPRAGARAGIESLVAHAARPLVATGRLPHAASGRVDGHERGAAVSRPRVRSQRAALGCSAGESCVFPVDFRHAVRRVLVRCCCCCAS